MLFGICFVILLGMEYDRMQNDTSIPEYSIILTIIALIGLLTGCGAIALANSRIMKN